jgi:hypothetical protein
MSSGGFILYGSRRTPLLLFALFVFTGCGTLIPDTPLEHPEVISRLEGWKRPLPIRVGVSVGPSSKPLDVPRHGAVFSVDGRDLRGEIVKWLRESKLFEEVVELSPRVTGRTPPREKARELGLKIHIHLEPGGGKVTYVGRNIWWWPSLIAWLLAWFPSWVIPDETFSMEMWGAVEIRDPAKDETLASFAAVGSVAKGLDDIQRGFHLFGIFRAPACLNKYDYRSVRRRLRDRAWCDFTISLLLGLFKALEREYPRAREK